MGGLVVVGSFVLGSMAGYSLKRLWLAVLITLILAVAAIAYVYWWQVTHPDNLNSTSALEYLFAPLYPIVGMVIGRAIASKKVSK